MASLPDGSLSPFQTPATEGERATRSRMRDLRREIESYRSLFESSRCSLDNEEKLVANESRDTVVDIIQCLRSDETISPVQKAHVDKIVAEALSLLRTTHRFIIDSAPADLQNFSVFDTLSDTAVSGGADASGHLDSVQGIQGVGQTPTGSGQVNSIDPDADDRISLSGDEEEDDYLSPSESASLAELRESEDLAKERSVRTRIDDAADRTPGGYGSRPSAGGTAPAADSDKRGRRAAPTAAQRGSGHCRVDGCSRSDHAGDGGGRFSTPSSRRVRINDPASDPNHDSEGNQNAFFKSVQSL